MLFTLFVLAVYRFGSVIPVPFIDVVTLSQIFTTYGDTLLGYINIMSGGGLSSATLFALSIYPYINASIIIQLLTIAIPALERMAKEGGEEGQKKIAAITRYATLAIGLIMGFTYYIMVRNQGLLLENGVWPAIVIILSFTAGSVFIMWLGEQVTEKGVGNGISVILFAGIVSRGPSMVSGLISMLQLGTVNWIGLICIIVGALAFIAFIVFMSNAERRIPVQYAKRVVGRKMYGGQSTHLPVKVNMSGVMPIIFASSILQLPGTIAAFATPTPGTFWYGFASFFSPSNPGYMVLYFFLIIGFAYFYAAVQFNPIEIANNMKKNGGFIPGFRPGKPTSDFITRVLNKVTLIGALFLGLIAILPLAVGAGFNMSSIAISGTSVLILVGVALETVKQIESQMLMRHYKGFLE